VNRVVLDASAVLAYLWQEHGWEQVERSLVAETVLISAVNLSEVASKALERGMDENTVREMLGNLDMQEVPFDSESAWACALLRTQTKVLGLSLADRACLALAQARGIAAVTADRSWLQLRPGIQVESIR